MLVSLRLPCKDNPQGNAVKHLFPKIGLSEPQLRDFQTLPLGNLPQACHIKHNDIGQNGAKPRLREVKQA
jgi:hypothetical protein